MRVVITDPALLELLVKTADPVEVHDPNGKQIGTFAPTIGKFPAGYVIPFSEEEMESRRGMRGGRPLDEILKSLQERQ